jgi:hypothetical protein
MKKFLFLSLIFCAIISTTTYAQAGGPAGGNPASVLQSMKEKQGPPMVEKTGLTVAQVDRIIEINFEIRQSAVGLRDLNEADRAKKLADLKALKEKKYSEIPLTADQIKAVYAYYEDMGKNNPPKTGN